MPRYNNIRKDERRQREKSWDNVLGFVTKVHEHDGDEDRISNHEVNVQLKHREEEFKRIPVHTDHNGTIYVPQKNDMVEVGFLKSTSVRPVVVNVVYTGETRAPLARAGHFRREFGDASLYMEAEKKNHTAGDPDVVRFAKKNDGLSNAQLAIELDDSGANPIATIRKNDTPDSDQNSELSMGIDEEDSTAFIQADPNDNAISEGYVEVSQDASIEIFNKEPTDIVTKHAGNGDITVEHTDDGKISITNEKNGEITITNNAAANINITAASGDLILDGDSVTLGAGGTDIIKDVSANTTTDADGHVTSVSLDITRSSVVSTE